MNLRCVSYGRIIHVCAYNPNRWAFSSRNSITTEYITGNITGNSSFRRPETRVSGLSSFLHQITSKKWPVSNVNNEEIHHFTEMCFFLFIPGVRYVIWRVWLFIYFFFTFAMGLPKLSSYISPGLLLFVWCMGQTPASVGFFLHPFTVRFNARDE
jgi:hypothetical protein